MSEGSGIGRAAGGDLLALLAREIAVPGRAGGALRCRLRSPRGRPGWLSVRAPGRLRGLRVWCASAGGLQVLVTSDGMLIGPADLAAAAGDVAAAARRAGRWAWPGC